jgi:O-antigen ligase
LILTHYDAIHPAAFGMILFLATKATSRNGINIFYLLAMFAISAYILAIGRGANFLSFAALGLFLLLARQVVLLIGMAGGVVFMICALLVAIEVNPSVGRERLRQIEDQLEVMVDPAKIAGGKTTDADTADWRVKWWQKITRDVNAHSPLFGFGFGADIASDFHREFFRVASVNPDIGRTRGAHNAFFTVLARMGWLGGLCFLGVVVVQLWYFWRAAGAFRDGLIPPSQAFFWGSNICAFVITFFQYSWEAPYSAIPAWTCMGLSYAYLDGLRKPTAEPQAEATAPATLPNPRRARIPRVAHPSV